ncbi:MAG: Cof-type HAD-IIB family hydrolase [Streptococcaceae bacterium]|nr:Cof-type HAD-IIB family hydrolase [Streptococcaceae bacterium]
MNKKVAFFDIDGTLADNTMLHEPKVVDRIPESAKLALTQLRENGINPVLATGRSVGMVKDLMEELKMNSVVSSNGAVVVFKGEVIWESYLSEAEVDRIAQLLLKKKKTFILETKDVIFQLNKGNVAVGDGSFEIVTWEGSGYPEKVIQIVVIETDEFPEGIDTGEIHAVRVGMHEYDIKKRNVTKAIGIRHLLNAENLTAEEAIAFGDEENDMEMFQEVSFSIALGNGNEKLKAIADYVTTSVKEDGVYNACKKYGWLGE